MKKYTVYSWYADDEGGLGVCLTEEFNPSLGYNPLSGWRAKPSEKLGEFNTIEELTDIIFDSDPEWYGTKEYAMEDALLIYPNK